MKPWHLYEVDISFNFGFTISLGLEVGQSKYTLIIEIVLPSKSIIKCSHYSLFRQSCVVLDPFYVGGGPFIMIKSLNH